MSFTAITEMFLFTCLLSETCSKNSIIWDNHNNNANFLEMEQFGLTGQKYSKDADGISKTVNPDQTRSSLT